jgi:hypothetical protein
LRSAQRSRQWQHLLVRGKRTARQNAGSRLVDLGFPAVRQEDWRAWWSRHGERELRCILVTAWDPLGAGFDAGTWDEYDGYASQIARRIYEADDEVAARDQVAAVLDAAEADLGWSGDRTARNNARLAAAIVAWHEWSFVRGGSVAPPRA